MGLNKIQFRHGDVLLEQIADVPQSLPNPRTGERKITVAYGEQSGHSHVVIGDDAKMLSHSKDEQTTIDLPYGGYITHEEHGRIDLPPGQWQVRTQVEYTEVGERNVVD